MKLSSSPRRGGGGLQRRCRCFHAAPLAIALLASLRWLASHSRLLAVGRASPPPPRAVVGSISIYTPSALEAAWSVNIGAWDAELCAILASPAQREAVVLMLKLLDSQERFAAGTPAHADLLRRARDAGYLSRLDLTLEGGEQRSVLLEPLIGMLRDPRTGCSAEAEPNDAWQHIGTDHIEKKMWHLVAPPAQGVDSVRRSRHGPENGRAVLFDMGATAWGANGRHNAHGARWLSGAYAAVGVVFEDIYSWEAMPTNASDFFRGAELDDIGRLHFMNWPVSSGDDLHNPWHLLKRVTAPQDFVVVKLDIDTPAVESELVRQLLADPALHALVDVFYFEHHVRIADFEWMWARFGYHQTLADSYAIFAALRQRGIRAHSWP